MENYIYVSKDTIEMVNKVYQALLLAKKGLLMWFVAVKINGVRTSWKGRLWYWWIM